MGCAVARWHLNAEIHLSLFTTSHMCTAYGEVTWSSFVFMLSFAPFVYAEEGAEVPPTAAPMEQEELSTSMGSYASGSDNTEEELETLSSHPAERRHRRHRPASVLSGICSSREDTTGIYSDAVVI